MSLKTWLDRGLTVLGATISAAVIIALMLAISLALGSAQ
jgi:hypothetical protein